VKTIHEKKDITHLLSPIILGVTASNSSGGGASLYGKKKRENKNVPSKAFWGGGHDWAEGNLKNSTQVEKDTVINISTKRTSFPSGVQRKESGKLGQQSYRGLVLSLGKSS